MTTNVDRINEIYAAFGRGDIDHIFASVADDVDWGLEANVPQALAWLKAGRGRDKVKAYFKGVGENMDFHSFVPKLVLGQGNEVLTLVEVSFTGKRTGKRLDSIEAMHFTFDDKGKITRYRIVLDTAGFAAACVG